MTAAALAAARALRVNVANLVTLIGLCCSVAFLAYRFVPLAIAALVCDTADGAIARRLGVSSSWGAELDWHVDVVSAAVAAWLIHPLALLALPLWLAVARVRGWRVSLRVACFIALAVVEMVRAQQ